jgi:transcriptional regulator with XRE-family HTH domain
MIGEDFKKWRETTNFTQAEIAKQLEVSEMTVYRWETGKAPISRAVELALKQLEVDQAKEKEG